MSKTTTLNQEHEATMLPRKETINFILAYSKSYSVQKTKFGNMEFHQN